MKRLPVMLILMVILVALAGCGYHLEWADPVVAKDVGRGWVVRDIYYAFDPSETGGGEVPKVRIEAEFGTPPPSGPVEWSIFPEDIGRIWGPIEGDYTLRLVEPLKAGEAVLTAVVPGYDGPPATCRYVVWPQKRLLPGATVDIDGDGTADIIVKQDAAEYPYGARLEPGYSSLIDSFASVPVEALAPENALVTFTEVSQHNRVLITRSSLGFIFATTLRSGGSGASIIAWRKLRD